MSRRILSICGLLFVLAALPPIDFAATDIRMLQTFSLDEAAFAAQVRHLVEAGSLEVEGFTYGALYPYVALLLTGSGSWVSPVSDTFIIVALRLISLLSALATGAFTYLIGRRLFDERSGLIAAALVLSSPLVFRWTVEIHPDTLQLFFLTASLYYITSVARKITLRDAALCSAFAGLAMGTKYGGVFLIPTIGLALLLGIPKDTKSALGDRTLWTGALVSAAAFVAAFILTNPYAILHFGKFQQDLSFTRLIVSDTEGSALSWFALLLNPKVGVVCGLGLLATIAVAAKKEWLLNGGLACVLFWIVSYIAFLVGNVRFIAPQYLLLLVPAFSILVSVFLVRIASRLPTPSWAALSLTTIVLAFQLVFAAPQFASRTIDETTNPVISAGLWLSENYTPDTTILYDTYAYIPSRFTLADTYFGLAYPVIQIMQPDVVVTRKSIRDRYRHPDRSDHFRLTEDRSKQADFLYLSPQRYRDIHYTYTYLDGGLTNYTLVQDFDEVTIHERDQKVDSDDVAHRWRSLVTAQRGEGVDAGLAANAYARFAKLHTESRNWEEAKVQLGRAIQLDNANVILRYDYALALANQDSFSTAESHIDQISKLVTEPADPWLKLGWDYYLMKEFERSRKASRRAHDLHPNQPFSLYNIALSYLVEGNANLADSAYRAAAAKHPLPDTTAALLNQMIADGTLKGESLHVAQRVLKRGN